LISMSPATVSISPGIILILQKTNAATDEHR
jgi:hypothetical protein